MTQVQELTDGCFGSDRPAVFGGTLCVVALPAGVLCLSCLFRWTARRLTLGGGRHHQTNRGPR